MTVICGDMECGTGDWSGPLPGDPNSNIGVTATPAFGGIDVAWSFPTINPHAVAHIILYRGLTAIEENATRLAIVSGTTYYDKTIASTPITWYYWVQVVSINGTYGEMIGPAYAMARPTITEILLLMSQRIDAGILSQSLKSQIDMIEINSLGLSQELLDRAASNDELGAAYNEVMAFSTDTRALLQTEILARTTAESAFVDSVNTLYANVGATVAAVQETQSAHADLLVSQASSITATNAVLNGNTTSGEVGLISKITTAEGEIDEIGTLYTAKLTVNGLIGGFGIYNDGTSVQAGFDVDTFWVGRTANDKTKPFVVEGEEVYIKEAVIKSLTFTKLRSDTGALTFINGKLQADFIAVEQLNITNANISGDLRSDNYVAGSKGWILKK